MKKHLSKIVILLSLFLTFSDLSFAMIKKEQAKKEQEENILARVRGLYFGCNGRISEIMANQIIEAITYGMNPEDPYYVALAQKQEELKKELRAIGDNIGDGLQRLGIDGILAQESRAKNVEQMMAKFEEHLILVQQDAKAKNDEKASAPASPKDQTKPTEQRAAAAPEDKKAQGPALATAAAPKSKQAPRPALAKTGEEQSRLAKAGEEQERLNMKREVDRVSREIVLLPNTPIKTRLQNRITMLLKLLETPGMSTKSIAANLNVLKQELDTAAAAVPADRKAAPGEDKKESPAPEDKKAPGPALATAAAPKSKQAQAALAKAEVAIRNRQSMIKNLSVRVLGVEAVIYEIIIRMDSIGRKVDAFNKIDYILDNIHILLLREFLKTDVLNRDYFEKQVEKVVERDLKKSQRLVKEVQTSTADYTQTSAAESIADHTQTSAALYKKFAGLLDGRCTYALAIIHSILVNDSSPNKVDCLDIVLKQIRYVMNAFTYPGFTDNVPIALLVGKSQEEQEAIIVQQYNELPQRMIASSPDGLSPRYPDNK
jgi:hypothetical protein